MNFSDRKTVDYLRQQFPVGCRIVLDHMDDPFVSIPPGTQGTCRGVDDAGNVMVAWDCASSLSIAFGADRAHRVASEEEIRVSLNWLGNKQQTAGNCIEYQIFIHMKSYISVKDIDQFMAGIGMIAPGIDGLIIRNEKSRNHRNAFQHFFFKILHVASS